MPGGDAEAHRHVDANGPSLVVVAQRRLLVDLLGQSQGCLHLDDRAGPKSTYCTEVRIKPRSFKRGVTSTTVKYLFSDSF